MGLKADILEFSFWILMSSEGDLKVLGNIDSVVSNNPHSEDPRFLSSRNMLPNCFLRFTQFCRCARELGDENVRCKYYFHLAQSACIQAHLDEWMEHRARGTSEFDLMPDRTM